MVRVKIICHPNLEECEALIAYDLFSRVNYDIKLVSVNDGLEIKSIHNLNFKCDEKLSDLKIDELDMIYIPGGKGVLEIINHQKLLDILSKAFQKNKIIAAICAAGDILAKLNIVNDLEFSCYPNCDHHKKANNQAISIKNNIFTAKALGVSFEFCFEIIKYISGETIVNELKNQIYYKGGSNES